MPSKEQTITIPLSLFVDSHLGRRQGWTDREGDTVEKLSHRPIDPEIAILIFALTKNEHTCYIQWADKYNPELKQPVLWDYEAWAVSTEKWERSRRRMEQEADEREVFNANVRLVAIAWARFANVELNRAEYIATAWLRKGNMKAIETVGVKQLYTNVKELQ